MRAVRTGPLPASAGEAAAHFYRVVAPQIGLIVEDIAVVFPPAPYDHRGWRLAAVQDLGRSAAPARVNGVVGADERAIAETLAYLAEAPGVTGQLLAVDGKTGETR